MAPSRKGEQWKERARDSAFFRNGGSDLILIASLAGQYACMKMTGAHYNFMILQETPYWFFYQGFFWAVFVLAILILPLKLKSLFVNPALEFLGRISYSVYLVHFPLISLIVDRIPDLEQAFESDSIYLVHSTVAVSFLLVLGVSWATYRAIEIPFLSLKRTLSSPGG